MRWNWQHKSWPEFDFESRNVESLEREFLLNSGQLRGSIKHFVDEESQNIRIELLSQEALLTSQIEGDFLNRDSIQSSVRRAFGLKMGSRKSTPAEQGVAEMMVAVYRSYDQPLSHEMLFSWHRMLFNGRMDLDCIGNYRQHEDPMQIVSGPMGMERVHFEAPPSRTLNVEMNQFLEWFNESEKGLGNRNPLIRAAIAHLYFESIHPFEDGNGRIGRALVEKSLSQNADLPCLIALSTVIAEDKKRYYRALHLSSQTLQVDEWLSYFCPLLLKAQEKSQSIIDFTIRKSLFFKHFESKLNERQEKVLERMFREGVDGFTGGLSANKYGRIAKTSSSTATRDLLQLTEMGALTKTGVLKGTRYHLNLSNFGENV